MNKNEYNRREFVIYDTEFWSTDGSHTRGWMGIQDKAEYTIQIGGIKILIDGGFVETESFSQLIRPRDEYGDIPLSSHISSFTGITQGTLDKDGVSMASAMNDFVKFVGDRRIWSYGTDYKKSLVWSCLVNDIIPPFHPRQAMDVRHVLISSGMTIEEINNTNSGALAKRFGVDVGEGREHEALYDCKSILGTLKHLHGIGKCRLEFLSD